jgi:hypothetical protein
MVGLHKDQPLRHKEVHGRVLPADRKPFCFCAGMEKRGAAAVLGEPANPAGNLVAIEGAG